MAAWRCLHCSVNFPSKANSNVLMGKCPKCKGALNYWTNAEPTKDWQKLTSSEEPKKEGPKPGPVHPDTSDGLVLIYRDDTDSIHVMQEHLTKLGYDPHVGDIIRVAGKHYELEGYDTAHKSWWIQRMEFDADHKAIQLLPGVRGLSSDDLIFYRDDDVDVWFMPEQPDWFFTDNDPED